VTGPNERAPEADTFEHLTDADLAGFLDRDLTPDERRRVEIHIDHCAVCRAELVAVSRITQPDSAQGRPATNPRWWIPAAAAAAVVALAIPSLTRTPPAPSSPATTRRIADGDGRSHLTIVAPTDSIVASDRLVFSWRSGKADGYRFFLLTESGAPVWSADTSDTTITLPDSVVLQPGRAYFWRVEGIGNGIAARTGFNRIQIRRE
jgi:hypothetical protein